jgi:hypothetical protein
MNLKKLTGVGEWKSIICISGQKLGYEDGIVNLMAN